MKIVNSLECCDYFFPYHPESPDRIKNTVEYLKKKTNYEFLTPNPCGEEILLLAHTKEMVQSVKSGKFYDPDTPFTPNIYYYATLSVGGSILAMEISRTGEPAFSLMRPPGHHASSSQAGGFCYFNNIAIAVKKFLKEKPNSKVAILDIDCHHGNGTEEIFLNDQKVIFVSLHQVPLYPGTGLKSKNNCYNFPYPPGTSESEYLKILEKGMNLIVDFKPDLIAVSAGFDTYYADPLTQTNLNEETYKKISEMISQAKINRFAVLEGGYSENVPLLIYNFLCGFE